MTQGPARTSENKGELLQEVEKVVGKDGSKSKKASSVKKRGDSSSAGSKPVKKKRKSPAFPWKKPKDMPKRPLSAYNLFFKAERTRLLKSAAAGPETGSSHSESELSSSDNSSTESPKRQHVKVSGIGFANLAKTIAASWKNVDEATKAPFEARAAIDKQRYDLAVAEWREKQKKSTNAPEPVVVPSIGIIPSCTPDSSPSMKGAAVPSPTASPLSRHSGSPYGYSHQSPMHQYFGGYWGPRPQQYPYYHGMGPPAVSFQNSYDESYRSHPDHYNVHSSSDLSVGTTNSLAMPLPSPLSRSSDDGPPPLVTFPEEDFSGTTSLPDFEDPLCNSLLHSIPDADIDHVEEVAPSSPSLRHNLDDDTISFLTKFQF